MSAARLQFTKQMKDAIRRSGYLFEQRLVPLIERHGYKATPNHAFEDQDTGETREVDVMAITGNPVSASELDFIFAVLLIQCKNLRAPLTFFTQDEIPIKELAGEIQAAGIPLEIVRKGETLALSEFLETEKFHHYYRWRRLSSQFCCVYEKERGGKRDWVAGHEMDGIGNLYQKMVLPLVKAVEAQKIDYRKKFKPDPDNEPINVEFYYPILVTSGPIWECFVGRRRPRYRRVHRVPFIRRHESRAFRGEYRIDVVDEIGLRRLLDTIDKEMGEISRRMKSARPLLLENTRRIAKGLLKKRDYSVLSS